MAGRPAPPSSRGGREAATPFLVGDYACANVFAPAEFQGRRGLITEAGPGDSEYRVEFEDNRMPTTAYLMAWWLDPAEPPR